MAPVLSVEETNFHNACIKILRNILSQGRKITLIDNRGKQDVIDSCQTIVLSGYALEQISRMDTHPENPYLSTPTYCKEWTPDFLNEHIKNPRHKDYLAYGRLAAYPASNGIFINQIAAMRDSLAKQLKGGYACNNSQAITWYPKKDLTAEASPFVQRIWARIYPGGKIDAHFYWRATDAYNHFQSRMICILNMFKREVADPNGCRFIRAVCVYDSLYVNAADIASAGHVGMAATNPRLNYF